MLNMNQRRRVRRLSTGAAAILTVAVASGCAATRVKPTELVQAHEKFDQTASQPEVARRAPVALLQARKLVDHAEEAFANKKDKKAVYLATLATQRVEIAENHAQALAAKAESEEALRQLKIVRALAREASANRALAEARGQVHSARLAADDLSRQLTDVRSQSQARETASALDQARDSRRQLDEWLTRQGAPTTPPVQAAAPVQPAVPQYSLEQAAAIRQAQQIAIQDREEARALSARIARMEAVEQTRLEASRRMLGLQESSSASVQRSRELQAALDRAERRVSSLQAESDQSANEVRQLRNQQNDWTDQVKRLEIENQAERARIEALSSPTPARSEWTN